MDFTVSPAEPKARIADSRPPPGPSTSTSMRRCGKFVYETTGELTMLALGMATILPSTGTCRARPR